jgi:hypothetical protein
MWTPLRFTRSTGSGWIWYVTATDGRQEALWPIPAFRSLLAQNLANRGPAPPYITDDVLARKEAERLTPAEIADRERRREIQESITAADNARAEAQAREIQSLQAGDLGIIGPAIDWARTAGPLGVPRGAWALAGVLAAVVVVRSALSGRR